MTRLAISTRDRRTLTIGASAIAALFVISRGVPAWRTWVHDAKAGAREQITAATQSDALIAGARAARDTLAVRKGRYVALAPALVSGVTPAEASASLASMVSQWRRRPVSNWVPCNCGRWPTPDGSTLSCESPSTPMSWGISGASRCYWRVSSEGRCDCGCVI